jgi:nicotinamidase-related amidase
MIERVDPARSALLLLDMQLGYLGLLADQSRLLRSAARAATAARAAGMRVVYPCVSFRTGQPELSRRNTMFGSPSSRNRMIVGSEEVRIHPDVAPRPGDLVLTRPRTSAFAGSSLAEVLRAADVTTLVLAGTATSGVVLATAIAADDLDFAVVVLGDAVADPDPRVQEVLVRDVLPQYGRISTVDAFRREVVGG